MYVKLKYILALLLIPSCTWMSSGEGQVIYHWERESTGIQKFTRDHSECMREAEDFRLLPDLRTWFYSEEIKMDIRVDWHADKGVWASYIPYPGAEPLIVHSLRSDDDVDPRDYRLCMEKRGYWHRTANIPTTTNLFVYKPQNSRQYIPFNIGYQ